MTFPAMTKLEKLTLIRSHALAVISMASALQMNAPVDKIPDTLIQAAMDAFLIQYPASPLKDITL